MTGRRPATEGRAGHESVIVADHISFDAVEPYDEIVEELAERGMALDC